MYKKSINNKLVCIVDYIRDDCRREEPHCHITKRGERDAQVWLNPVQIEGGHSLGHNEIDDVYDFVNSHRYELQNEYLYNKENGEIW